MQAESRSLDVSRVSIVICTDGRAEVLANTLHCLQYLDGPFEVCVIHGPTEDATTEVLAEWSGRIKVARNPECNLSASRNVGIAMAAGEIVALIDDDSPPEPTWLQQILRAFDDPQVAGAGGIVRDHTGVGAQYLYATVDRLGNLDRQRTTPADLYNFPLSFNFPYLQGSNCAFRRGALLAIGGFDEEFECYLGDADVCCRLVDDGWLISQLPDAVVHQRSIPSTIRIPGRTARILYPVLKSKLYFSLINNQGHYPTRRAIEDMAAFVDAKAAELHHQVDSGRLPSADIENFRADVDRARIVGLERGTSGQRRLLQPHLLEGYAAAFLQFPRPLHSVDRSAAPSV